MSADLLIHCATPHEMAPFLKRFPPDAQKSLKPGFRMLSGKIHQTEYALVLSGPGVFNTICAISTVLERYKPALILQTGIAGIFEQTGGKVGDIAVATCDRYVHTGVAVDKSSVSPLPFDLIPGVEKTRSGTYDFEKDLVEKAQEKLEAVFNGSRTKISRGGFITVSSITGSTLFAQERYDAFNPIMEAMEGAACAHAARLYNVPVIEVRAASNIVGVRDKSQWDIEGATQQIAAICEIAAQL